VENYAAITIACRYGCFEGRNVGLLIVQYAQEVGDSDKRVAQPKALSAASFLGDKAWPAGYP
jgi:hypothetical protein